MVDFDFLLLRDAECSCCGVMGSSLRGFSAGAWRSAVPVFSRSDIRRDRPWLNMDSSSSAMMLITMTTSKVGVSIKRVKLVKVVINSLEPRLKMAVTSWVEILMFRNLSFSPLLHSNAFCLLCILLYCIWMCACKHIYNPSRSSYIV